MEWSKYFQPPEYQEATRQSFLKKDFAPLVSKYCGLESGTKILDVGCGTGAFSRYAGSTLKNASFCCVDNDRGLLDYGREINPNDGNKYDFSLGDALNLEYEEETFDSVVSHTFLTCISEPKDALSEMIRVLKKGGRVSSVTTMSLENQVISKGRYPEKEKWAERFNLIQEKIYLKLTKMLPICDVKMSIEASEMPELFASMDLKNIHIFPVARAFSLSDSSLTAEEKQRYINNIYIGEYKKISNVMELDFASQHIKVSEAEEYKILLRKRRDFWLANLNDNSIWEWFGGTAVLVSGVKEA